MSQPTTPQEAEAAQRAQANRETIRAYKRTFASEDGRLVLADLLSHYGFDQNGVENDDYVPGCTGIDVSRRDGTKSPLRYILKMRNIVLKPLGTEVRKGRAKSGSPRA